MFKLNWKIALMSDQEDIYIKALRRILRPMLRVLISRGITLPTLVQLIKRVYIEAAQDFSIPGKQLTDSRISLITGLHRRDVKSIREELATEVPAVAYVPMGARVISVWTGNADYLTEEGMPKALNKNGAGSFEELVASVNKDFRARTLLDEWLSKGIISNTDDGLLQLHVEAFVPSENEQEMLAFFGANIGDHVATAAHNLMNPGERILERAAYHNSLTIESVAELEALSQEKAMQLLVEINQRAVSLAKADLGKDGNTYQYRFGTYFYHSGMEKMTKGLE